MTLLSAALGCAAIAGRAAGGAVEAPLERMTEEGNLENVERIMTSPQVEESVREMSTAAAEGIVAGITGPESQRAVAELMTRSGDAIRNDLGPAVSSMVRETIDETMSGFLAEEHQAGMSRMASSLGAAATASVMRELGAGLERDVVPAMVRSFEEQVSPALVRELQDPELRAAMGEVARELAYHTVHGTNTGLAEVAAGDPVVGARDLGFPGRRLTILWGALVAALAGLGVALVAMIVLLVKGASQRRHLEEDSRRREGMLMGLVQSTLMHDATPEERREMLERLRAGTGFDFSAEPSTAEPGTEGASEAESPPRGLRWRPST